ncbi:MAG: P1 family peptidase [Thermomicrobiales bacterium]
MAQPDGTSLKTGPETHLLPEASGMVTRRTLLRGSALAAAGTVVAGGTGQSEAHAMMQPTISATPEAGADLAFDIPGLSVGIAEYREVPTGCTTFIFDQEMYPGGLVLELDVRGGAPGYSGDYGITNAVCIAGGSVYGLEATAGVASALYAAGGYQDLVAVAGAIIYDISMVTEADGGGRERGIYPDKALGVAAVEAARPGLFPIGAQGAGIGASVGQWVDFPARKEQGGQGGAYRQIGPYRIAFFTVVNALGVIVNRAGEVVRGGVDPATGEHPDPLANAEAILAGEELRAQPAGSLPPGGLSQHTTISLLVVNVDLPRELLRQLGRQVHSSMARAIHPFHTPDDGDILFTVSTAEIPGDGVDTTALGIVASEMAWDAVLASVGAS